MLNANVSQKPKQFYLNYNNINASSNYKFYGGTSEIKIILKNISSKNLAKFFVVATRILIASNSNIVTSKIDAIMEECKEENWDYEHAKALSVRAASNAKKFAVYIDDLETPEVIPSPNSDIIFIWKKNNNSINIIFNNDNQIIYVTNKNSEVCSGYFGIDNIKAVLSIVEDFLKNA